LYFSLDRLEVTAYRAFSDLHLDIEGGNMSGRLTFKDIVHANMNNLGEHQEVPSEFFKRRRNSEFGLEISFLLQNQIMDGIDRSRTRNHEYPLSVYLL